MPWSNVEIATRIEEALFRGDVDEMRRLLVEHPDCLRYEGLDNWLWMAASTGLLPAVEMLVDLGMGVNERHIGDAVPIESAAAEGHFDVVRWLLDHGAQINFMHHGQMTCFALQSATRKGHFDVVKLLIERGADIHAQWHGVSALMEADFYGHPEIAEYLRALGAQDVRATTPPDYDASHRQLLENMRQRQGEPSDWKLEVPGDPHVVIHHIAADGDHEVFQGQTLFTMGLSDHRLPESNDPYHCTELRMMLPADWPLSDAALADPQWHWPLEWLRRIINELRSAEQMPSYPCFFMNGDPPQPLATGTELCGWIGLSYSGNHCQMSDWRWVSLLDLFPIHAEERKLVLAEGEAALALRLEAHDIPRELDPARPNMADPQYAPPEGEGPSCPP